VINILCIFWLPPSHRLSVPTSEVATLFISYKFQHLASFCVAPLLLFYNIISIL
jgi:hypothetical protein